MNDNFTTTAAKAAIAETLVYEAGLSIESAERVVELMTTEGIIDFAVANELYEVSK